MRFRIESIKDGGLELDSTIPWEDLSILAEISASGDCRFLQGVRVRVRAQLVGDLVEVAGKVETAARFQCGGCLQDYEAALCAHFEVTYARHLPKIEEAEVGDEVEVTAEDLGVVLFQGDEIELDEAVQEQIAMILPVRRRCRESCKGLCSRCGTDLNQGECGCDRGNINLKFAALKDFKVDKSS